MVVTLASCISSDACVCQPCINIGSLEDMEVSGAGISLLAFVVQWNCDLHSFTLSHGLGLVRAVIVVYIARVS